MKNKNDIVALNDSQILRWICELNGIENLDEEVAKTKRDIKNIKKLPKSNENKEKLKLLYEDLYSLQYQRDYLCVIMNSNKDYDVANEGFRINSYRYCRLLGTNGGIKKSTITYIGENIYDEIVKRMDNGRDKTIPVIPAKLEAYQALICSGSTPVTMPRMLVVQDCNVKFTENVLKISDNKNGEPILTEENNCVIEYCDSDGYGFMSPQYSCVVNRDLYGDEFANETISGINTRYAWTKGMLFTFDFVEFAKRVNNQNYIVKDAWGIDRDAREYDVILTTSMVKLWDSYKSLEHYLECCNQNHYQFSVAKAMPHKLENVRNANYQFLQTYELNDSELLELCLPTIHEISDVLGQDWRKTLVFLKGMYCDNDTVDFLDDDFVKAIMIDKNVINDSFVSKKIHSMIKKRIEMAAKGSIKLSGNFAIVSGDLYSLAQSIFGLPVTGLLKSGEVYHRYWIDKSVEDIVLFRAPMTCHNNIRKRKVVHSEEMDFWYQYNKTGIILNSWDTTCDALNGADKDSDSFFTTDNKIIIDHTLNSLTIECIQRKAKKIIPTELDMVMANKFAFGDEIGTTTNRITAMIEKQSIFPKDSEEYKMLDYRIKCGQHYQQTAIDKSKGIIAEPMPKYWYSKSACKDLNENTSEEKQFKELCLSIVAENKPYFMKYVYPDLMARWNKYVRDTNSKCIREFKMTIQELLNKQNKTIREKEFLSYYEQLKPVGDNPCLINRISWLFEEKFNNFPSINSSNTEFDYSILKSGVEYSKNDFLKIKKIKLEYDDDVMYYQQLANKQRLDKDEVSVNRTMMLMKYKAKCQEICSNDKELCDIVLDICYTTNKSKQFAWDICGETIINNLLENNNHIINYPVLVQSGGDFEFGGEQFIMCKKQTKEDEDLLLF